MGTFTFTFSLVNHCHIQSTGWRQLKIFGARYRGPLSCLWPKFLVACSLPVDLICYGRVGLWGCGVWFGFISLRHMFIAADSCRIKMAVSNESMVSREYATSRHKANICSKIPKEYHVTRIKDFDFQAIRINLLKPSGFFPYHQV